MEHDVDYDSDVIDEDLEANLYASVCFDNEEYVKPVSKDVIQETDQSPQLISKKPQYQPVQLTQKPQTFSDTLELVSSPKFSSPNISTTPFEWKSFESNFTSLSAVADAIYLAFTGEVPPSVRQSSEKKRMIKSTRASTPTVARFSISDSLSATTPSKASRVQSPAITFNLPDQGDEEELKNSSDSVDRSLISSSEESDSERSMSNFEASDIIIGVSSAARHSFCGCSDDDAAAIAHLLRHSSSDPSYWQVDPLDRMPHLASRYYDTTRNIICSICTKRGHGAQDCTRVCFLSFSTD